MLKNLPQPYLAQGLTLKFGYGFELFVMLSL